MEGGYVVDNRVSKEGDSKMIKQRRNMRSTTLPSVILGVWLMAIATVPTRACLNDRDVITLAQASKSLTNPKALGAGLPGMVWVITGRFERNPDLYYVMRAQRVQKELQRNPQKLDLYDDIAVAYDRLHKDDEAILWMEKKKIQLERLAPKENLTKPEYKEHWYRYHANIGTFYAHRWLKTKNRSNMADMQIGFNNIARGLEIKPDAHFGREPIQLAAMEWILSGCNESFLDRLKSYNTEKIAQTITSKSLEYRFTYRYLHNDQYNHFYDDKMQTGLSGLIVLGAAWESIDIFKALAGHTYTSHIKGEEGTTVDNDPMGDFAKWRIEELQQMGRKSLEAKEVEVELTDDHLLKKQFQALRADADQWHKERTSYMLTRLQQGKHPDTNPDFWKEYKERPKPSLDMNKEDAAQWRAEHPKKMGVNTIALPAILGAFCLGAAFTLWGIFWVIRRAIIFAQQRKIKNK
jgi:hypothetical protein